MKKITVQLDTQLLHPYQVLLEIVRQLNPGQVDTFKKDIFESYGQYSEINDWVALESFGNLVAIKAQHLSEKCASLINEPQLFIAIQLGSYRLTQDNYYSILFLAKRLKLQVLYRESVKMSVAPLQHQEPSVDYAYKCLAIGAYEIATNMLLHLIKTCPKKDMEHFIYHLQIIRFYSHQYQAVCEQDYPMIFQQLDEKSAFTLYYLKAYSATLIRDVKTAKPNFDMCNTHSEIDAQHEYQWYQLNIFALFNVINDNKQLAYILEKRIEAGIENNKNISLSLKYVNYMNIARLHKMSHEYDKALLYYKKAFTTISGGNYTSSDTIYFHMNFGSVAEATKCYQEALVHWLKAAVHWLISENHYALAWRPKIILCKEKTTELNTPICINKVADFFINKIKELIKLSNLSLTEDVTLQSLDLHRCDDNISQCIVNELGIFYVSKSPTVINHDPQLLPLTQLVKQILSTMMPGIKNIKIDTYFSEFTPSQEAAKFVSDLLNCERLSYFQKDLLFGDTCFKESLNHTLRLSPLITSIKVLGSESIDLADKPRGLGLERKLSISYQRSFMGKIIQDTLQIKIIKAIVRNNWNDLKITDNYSINTIKASVREMLLKQVLTVVTKEKVATEYKHYSC